MTDLRMRIRIGSANAGDRETQTYTDATFAEAVLALQGTHKKDDSPDGGYHRDTTVYVVNTYDRDHTEPAGYQRGSRPVDRKLGEPIFGEEVTVYGRRIGFAELQDAQVSWASGGSMDTAEAHRKLALITLAIQLADAANAEPFCATCQATYEAREGRIAAAVASARTPTEG